MMPTRKALLTSDGKKGRRYVEICRAQYDHAELDDERGQVLNENPAFAVGLRELIATCSTPVMPVKAPNGGRLHIVRVPVNPARSWKDAVCALPNSEWRESLHALSEASDAYPPVEGGTFQREIILVNFGTKIANGQITLDWADAQKLRPASPREVFAVCEHKISLHLTLEVDFLRVLSTVLCEKSHYTGKTTCTPAAMWSGARRWAKLVEFDCSHDEDDWFAFVRS